jgi:hypothetical protein
MIEIKPYKCPNCNNSDYVALNPHESYCLTCKGYFNRSMKVVYKKRIPWNKLDEMYQNRRNK